MIMLSIICDGCDRVDCATTARTLGNQPPRAHLLRKELRGNGWSNNGMFDYCPDCSARRAAGRPTPNSEILRNVTKGLRELGGDV
jgi:hypothetical protein